MQYQRSSTHTLPSLHHPSIPVPSTSRTLCPLIGPQMPIHRPLTSISPFDLNQRLQKSNTQDFQALPILDPLYESKMSQQPANFGTVTCSQQSGASLFDSELPFKIELSQDEKINREVSFSYGAHQDFCGVHASFPPQKNQCESSDECQKHPKAACPSSLSPPLPSLNNQQQQDYTATSLYDVGTDPYAGSRTHNSVYRYSEPLGSHDSFSLAESSARSAVLSSQFTASPYNAQHEGFDRSSTTNNEETDIEEKNCDPPYAKLIYQALMDVPEHKMVLRDIYRWIEQNTDKARDPAFKGWQNSVRHNLSMNGVR